MVKRLTSHEAGDPEEFCKTEFADKAGQLDLRLSVYEAPLTAVVQVLAEHAACAGLRPPGHPGSWDMTGVDALLQARPDCEHFAFVRESHREIISADEAEVRRIAAVVLATRFERFRSFSKNDIREFVRQRLRDDDAEWIAFCRDAPRGQDWKKLAG